MKIKLIVRLESWNVRAMVLAYPTIYVRLMTPGKPPSSTASADGSKMTSLHFRGLDFREGIALENKKTRNFSKGTGRQRTQGCTASDLRGKFFTALCRATFQRHYILSPIHFLWPTENPEHLRSHPLPFSRGQGRLFMRIWRQLSKNFPPPNSCSCSETSTTLGPVA